jgi:hypothetical protein
MRFVLLASILAGCGTDLGTCDPELAREIVYDDLGRPAYVGQAQVIVSCGNGAFCHFEGAMGDNRFGAPAELDFDVQMVSGMMDALETERLRRNHARVIERAEQLYSEVEGGSMPPYGEATVIAHAGVPQFRFLDDRGLPRIDAVDGLPLFRNWLACGAPVVERTTPRPAGITAVGDVVGLRPVPLEPTYTSIYQNILFPLCGASCHNPADPARFGLALLDLSDKDESYTNLVNAPAVGVSCEETGRMQVVPGDPENSLLVQKLFLSPDLCGDPMPQGAALLPTETVDVVRAWIDNGAMND